MVVGDPVSALRALADPTRLALARLLAEGAFTVGELQEALDLGQSTASRHLKILADAGLLACRREGRLAFYEWPAGLPPALEGLQRWVQEYAPVLDDQTRRRLHEIFEGRARRTRRFFEGPAAEALALGKGSERSAIGGVDATAQILEHLPRGGTIVDLGTGAGSLLGLLSRRGKQVIGVDASPRMLEAAARRVRDGGLGNVDLRLGTLEHLPLREHEADAAIAHLVLHHAARPEVVLAEAGRVLKPGGTLVIADFLPHDREWMREELADQWLGFDPQAMGRMLEAAGFQAVVVTSLPVDRQELLGKFVASGRRAGGAAADTRKFSSNNIYLKSTPPRVGRGGKTVPRAPSATRRAKAPATRGHS